MRKVLIVEDDSMLAEIYQKKFDRIGTFEVIRAASGVEAIEKAKTEVPDLILLDLVLPEMDGFDVLKSLRSIKKLDSTKIIPFSNLSLEDNRKKLEELGADGFISKSEHTPQQLVVEVEKIFQSMGKEEKTERINIKHVQDSAQPSIENSGDILIIEDEEVFLDIFGRKLEEAGLSVDKARSGKEGVDFLLKKKYRVVILDIVLPDLEAKKILSEFKSHFPKSKTKFVILKSEADLKRDVDELKAVGAGEIIDKDKIDPEQFVSEIKNI